MQLIPLIGGFLFLIGLGILIYAEKFAVRKQLPVIQLILCGCSAWTVVLGLLGWFGGILYYVYLMFETLNQGLAFLIAAMLLGTAGAWRFWIVWDIGHIIPFVRYSLSFSHYIRNAAMLREETMRHETIEAYRATTGKTLRMPPSKTMKFKTEEEILQLQDEAEQVTHRAVKSVHFEAERDALNRKERISMLDTWRLNAPVTPTHAWYESVTRADVDPQEQRLAVTVTLQRIDRPVLQSRGGAFSLLQQMYDFLQAFTQEQWMQPYLAYVTRIELVCESTEDREFNADGKYEILSCSIPLAELTRRAGQSFAVTNIRTIAALTYAEPSFDHKFQ